MDSRLEFARRNLEQAEVRGRSVLEVGANAVAGRSVRSDIEALGPSSYVGVDIESGPYVDEICDAQRLRQRFGEGAFDLVVSTEMLEHVRDWRAVVSNLKGVCAAGGSLLLTTRSRGFPYHAWPHDYWRYEPSDMERIFSDFVIDVIERDPEVPGVFVKATKPTAFTERDLSGCELFSMVKQRRARSITRRDERRFALAYAPFMLLRRATPRKLRRAVKQTPLSREFRVQRRAAP